MANNYLLYKKIGSALDIYTERGMNVLKATDTGSLIYSPSATNTNQQNLAETLIKVIQLSLDLEIPELNNKLCNSDNEEIRQIAREQNTLKLCRTTN